MIIINELVERFNNERPITQMINDKLNKEQEKKAAVPHSGKIYPSSIHKCSKALCYELLGYEKPLLDPRILRIMDNGNYMHERYQKMFKELGILVTEEAPIIYEELNISGRLDAIIMIDNNIAIAELKSCGENPFNKMKEANEPDPKYVAQIQLYMHITGVDLGVIYVENKNTQDVLEFWLSYDEEYCKKLLRKLKTVLAYVEKNSVIPREIAAELDEFMMDRKKMYNGKYVETCYYCRFCDYNCYCYSEEK